MGISTPITGKVDRNVERLLRNLTQSLAAHEARLAKVEKQVAQPPVLDPVAIAKQVQPHLTAAGPAALTINGMLGVAAQAQLAGVPLYPTNPNVNDPNSQPGSLVLVGATAATAVLKYWDGSTDPPTLVTLL
jgi:hypothetical protein